MTHYWSNVFKPWRANNFSGTSVKITDYSLTSFMLQGIVITYQKTLNFAKCTQ